MFRRFAFQRAAATATATTATVGAGGRSIPKQTAWRRHMPKTSPYTFEGTATTQTWDPVKGMPPKVNDTDYKKQQTFTIVHVGEPKPAKTHTPKPVLHDDIRDSPHFYGRNDTRAFPKGTLPTPAQYNLMTPWHRPSLHSIITDESTIVHQEISRKHLTVQDLTLHTTGQRSFPDHLKKQLRAEIFEASAAERAQRKEDRKEFRRMGNYARVVKHESTAKGPVGMDKLVAARNEYDNTKQFTPKQANALTVNPNASTEAAIKAVAAGKAAQAEAKTKAAAEASTADATGSGGTGTGSSGSRSGSGSGSGTPSVGRRSKKLAATPTTNIVEVSRDGTASEAAPLSNQPTQLTWKVFRTRMKNLPVYRDHKANGARAITIVRNFRGNMKDLRWALQAVVGPDVAVIQRLGRIDILGDHKDKICVWLATLGF